MNARRHSKEAVHERLEALVFMVMSSRRTLWPAAAALSAFPAARVDLVLEQLERIVATSVELGFHFAGHAADALERLADDDLPAWTLHQLETYDRAGIQGCINALRNLADFAAAAHLGRGGRRFEQVNQVLERFVTGLSGRNLRLAVAEQSYTDTETLYLPASVHCYAAPADNFLLYKATAAYLWAQGWYGTWRVPVAEAIAAYPDPQRALQLYGALEAARLAACLGRDLPGLWRAMSGLTTPWPSAWQALAAPLAAPHATAAGSIGLLRQAWDLDGLPPPQPYQGELFPQRVREAAARRAAREQAALQEALAVLADELGGGLRNAPEQALQFEARAVPSDQWPEGYAFQLVVGDQAIMPAADVQQLLDSVVQDFGHIPPEYLVAAGQGRYHRKRGGDRAAEAAATGEADACYDEWDHRRRTYRRNWARVRERPIHPQPDDLVERTLARRRGLLKHLRRTFEALRGEERLLKRQPQGENPDIDAIVEAYADQRAGLEPGERLFLKKQRVERNIAVLFMVDMSGSTKGWINEVEREALVLLCEALEHLGDRYAIYGFSGNTHLRCEVFRIKAFGEAYDATIKARIAGIRPGDYTRMGAVIRHLSGKLLAVDARTRVLITLSDGRPDDEDGYRGDYGIEDTRQAVLEARSRGIQPFCITIDDQAQDYLPHLFGRANYTLVEDVAKLPYKVSDIYRRITA